MQHTQSTRELSRIEINPRGDGSCKDCYLRRNIESHVESEDGCEYTVWEADEVHIVTSLSKDEIESSFDDIWAESLKNNMTDEERISKNESDILDIQEGIVEIYETFMNGGE